MKEKRSNPLDREGGSLKTFSGLGKVFNKNAKILDFHTKYNIKIFYGQFYGQRKKDKKGTVIMGRHGENIRKRKDGRWEGRYPTYCEAKHKQIYHSVYGKSYNEVREKLTVKHHSISLDSKDTVMNKEAYEDIRLMDVAEEWLFEIKNQRKPSTYIKYYFIFSNYIENIFDNVLLSEITSLLVKEKIPGYLSESIQKSIYCVLNQIIKFAFIKYSIMLPQIRRPIIPNSRSKPVKVLSRKEQKKLISALYRGIDIYKLAILISLFTGLRLGEVCALKWSDIDLDNKTLMVNRTVQRLYVDGHKTKTVLMEMVPKSAYSRREIPLSDMTFLLLIKFHNHSEYIFGQNKPMEPRTLQNHFKEALKEAQLDEYNFHILRHTFSTNCIEGGIDIKSLSEMLGHSDVQITLNRYVHPSMNTKRQHMDMLSRFYGQIYGQEK